MSHLSLTILEKGKNSNDHFELIDKSIIDDAMKLYPSPSPSPTVFPPTSPHDQGTKSANNGIRITDSPHIKETKKVN